jgi:hypothetical protein
VGSTTKETKIQTARDSITRGTERLRGIKEEIKRAKPELEEQADELLSTLNSALSAVEQIIPEDQKTRPTIRRFVRRLLSREVIIAVIVIISIWAGNLDAEQAIGVAVAGTGLILGRSVVKARPGTTEN